MTDSNERLVPISSFRSIDGYNVVNLMEVQAYLAAEGISATHETHEGGDGLKNFILKAPLSQAEEAKALLARWAEERK